MAASTLTSSSYYDRRVVERVHRYQWPGIQLNLWILIMTVASCLIIGVFASFIEIQQQLLLPIPWYFPYYITVASLVILFIGLLLWLVFQRRLLPAIVMIGAFMLFILWFVGLVVVSIQLWGPDGSISSTCNLAVFNRSPTGQNVDTLAWLQQRSICQAWQAVFSFALVGALFLVWIMVMAYQVFAAS
ncbi:hypothetical protein CMUS01_04599 [Colletotrichum musicola]|uniref:Uncharacterized protein n=3 Tax=Colletotrichum orchidearum species complex TaxID=2707337 RepID=A0A8H6KVN0_9PEZI|nr:hypothetical protein CSOJ01_14726 [Colletotrichum sojae]KAF6833165.1 hypothetical protein CPLU01_05684 [Colletotrichum plurivorum]KAF6838524.1 hypothetical protein CMUS01_04599 [Colletotrichum musicola]